MKRSGDRQHDVEPTCRQRARQSCLIAAVGLLSGIAVGCGGPNRANIELRKENQRLTQELSKAQQQNQADARAIAGLRDRHGTLPTLPSDRLDRLFTTHGIQFNNRLTGGADLDSSKPGDEGLAIYVIPVDQTGEPIKAAGSFDVEAFDLADPAAPLVGRWHFDLLQSKQAWNGMGLVYSYALICPWQKAPKHADLTVKVTFLDELTQTRFTAQRIVHVLLPSQAAATH